MGNVVQSANVYFDRIICDLVYSLSDTKINVKNGVATAARHTCIPFSAGSSVGAVPFQDPDGDARSRSAAENEGILSCKTIRLASQVSVRAEIEVVKKKSNYFSTSTRARNH